MNKELEEEIKRALITKHRGTALISVETLETVLNYIDNSIPKEAIEEKLEETKYRLNETMITEKDMQYNLGKCAALQELLEGK